MPVDRLRSCLSYFHHHQTSLTLPRSRSSPSPSPGPTGGKNGTIGRSFKRKPKPIMVVDSKPPDRRPTLGWTTSYQGGTSSSESAMSSDESDDEPPPTARGRAFSTNGRGAEAQRSLIRPNVSPKSSSDDVNRKSNKKRRSSFTRSRSPAPHSQAYPTTSQLPRSPVSTLFSQSPRSPPTTLLPAFFQSCYHVPLTGKYLHISVDSRIIAESSLILAALAYSVYTLSIDTTFNSRINLAHLTPWTSVELIVVAVASLLYLLSTHSILQATGEVEERPLLQRAPSSSSRPPTGSSKRAPSRDSRRQGLRIIQNNRAFSYIWMSVPKNYRDSADDGVLTGLLFGPLLTSALLHSALQQLESSQSAISTWRVEAPVRLQNSFDFTALEALVLSRFNAVNLSTLCSFILLSNVCASRWLEARYQKRSGTAPDGERRSVPRSEGRRGFYFIFFTLFLSLTSMAVKSVLKMARIEIWSHLSYLDIVVISLFYQFTLYVALRMAHRGFTLGELGVVCFGGTALVMEFLNFTIAKIWPITTPFIKTFRQPTPLLTFQIALIAGSFLTGFILAPFLVLSRSVAQRPVRRLKYPEQKLRQRRMLALGFYAGSVLIVGGVIGMWTRWCLGKRDPWVWVVFWVLDGRRNWSRPALLAYWGACGSLSVAGWNRQLARSRRYRIWNPNPSSAGGVGEHLVVPWAFDGHSSQTIATTAGVEVSAASPSAYASAHGNTLILPHIPNEMTAVASDWLDAADKRVPTLRLNARRKFFHALAVAMFVPGIAFDPAFTHLAFSAAFALFTFAEYVRYFAIYPFGASIHLFMNEFIDRKDSGTAILSHFYLLTGCSGSLWLEPSSRLLCFTGILVLGVGDALASIVGKRIGRRRWSPSSPKTVEGSTAFTISIVTCAWILRLLGMSETFSTLKYTLVISIASMLEAFSGQNDNLTLPLYTLALLALAGP